MPRKKGGLPYEVHPTPAKGKDGKNIMYVKPARGYKMNMSAVDQFCSRGGMVCGKVNCRGPSTCL